MMRKTFDKELATLNNRLIDMGNLCVDGIDLAIEGLFDKSKIEEATEKIHGIERDTDRHERDIEDLCMKMILRQQPVARDLKVISSALKMISDMERIGDQVADIVEIAQGLDENILNMNTHIKEMAAETKWMVINSVESFVNKDLEVAKEVIKRDEKVDLLFVQIKSELLRVMYQDISKGEVVLEVLMIAKYFERLGDHAENIAEWVTFAYS